MQARDKATPASTAARRRQRWTCGHCRWRGWRRGRCWRWGRRPLGRPRGGRGRDV